MEEYFVQKCVTADALAAPLAAVSTWSTAHRCECVMVQENAHANGASRAVLASIVEMMSSSRKTQRIALIILEPSLVASPPVTSDKLVPLDLSADWSWREALLTDSTASDESPLLMTTQEALEKVLCEANALSLATESPVSARPNVVVIDSLNVLLEIYPLARLLRWLRQLRTNPRVGSVVFRLNASALVSASASIVQTLAHEATAVVQVETPSSLRAYPILAKQRRREIPKRMHGMVLLLRKKKNGRTSESVEYFTVANGRMAYSSDGEAATATSDRKIATRDSPSDLEKAVRTPPASVETLGRGKALPVAANEVSFNLSISADEEAAKRNVELPYMHHRATGDNAVNTLLFIDDDDPDWDDDDLDDDLDI